ncbi:hypothetical protein CHLRE_16g686650v5 [Chlamydomonas reinhardtii]|uniref:E3 UFM1-protein ligase 1 homolog n=1 Tax=Chlamydomonas reinhardtii TaxID=3055 RepID=A0A2K3CUP4_CHLRE|nr:uncharacterized protein CHLRE_16g686650v5 [Chlamydomonas reinhardtii]PNW71999.1 hypothetical protein CHLRE_16g686650v5 [Chlamydomonas reinhardtii]
MEAALGLDLGSLLSQLTATQQAQSAAKLSERNVVELINKLRQLGILSEGELLHTLNGKEYMTVERLRAEVQKALRQAGGRLALVELPTIVGVDLIHCERQVAAIIAQSAGTVQEVNGELITTQYLDTIASEINDQLQESGQINVGELAAQYGLATELVMNVVTSRLGTVIQGRLEAGLLYTQSYLRAIKSQLRGALRAATGPVLVAALLKEVGLGVAAGDAGGGGGLAAALAAGGGGGVIATLIEELVQEGSLRGSLKGGGSSWTPAVYGEVAAEAVANFYSQNGWVGYDTVRRMGISNERAHLRAAFPKGVALESAYLAPQLLATLEAAVDDVLAANAHAVSLAGGGGAGGGGGGGGAGGGGGGGWVDVGPLLPSVLGPADVAALLGRLPALREQERRPVKERKAHVIGGTWVLSAALIAALQERLDVEARALAHKALAERKAGGGGAAATAAGGGGGGGAAVGGGGGGKGGKKGAAAAADDDDEDDWSMGPKGKAGKGKKGGGGKAAAAAAGGKGGKDAGGKGGGGGKDGGGGAGGGGGVTAAWIASKLPVWCPDMDWEDDGGGGGEDKAAAVAALLLAGAVVAYEEALQAAFTAGAEERRRAKEALSRSLEEAYGRLLLYGAGAEGFAAEDEATHATLMRHALRTTGAECVDLLHRWARAEYCQGEGEGAAAAAATGSAAPGAFLSASEVKAVLRAVPPDVAEGLAAAAEVPAAASVREAEALLDRGAAAVGVRVKKLDKKSEKAALAALRERLLGALSGEADPPAALALMVPLAHLRITGKAVSLPGKALGPVLGRLTALTAAAAEGGGGGGLSEELAACVRGLSALHEGVVDYLRAQSSSAPGGDTAAMLEQLTASLPPLKNALGLQVAGGAAAAAAAADV